MVLNVWTVKMIDIKKIKELRLGPTFKKNCVTITGPPLKQIHIWSAASNYGYNYPVSLSWQTLQFGADAEGSLKTCAAGKVNYGSSSIMAIFTTDKQLGIKKLGCFFDQKLICTLSAGLLNPNSSTFAFTSSMEINNDVIVHSSKSVKFLGKFFFRVVVVYFIL